jgi:hypothetical protein
MYQTEPIGSPKRGISYCVIMVVRRRPHSLCGGPTHRSHSERREGCTGAGGTIYFWCVAGVASSALIMAIWPPILLLALIAMFSFQTAIGRIVYFCKSRWKTQSAVGGLDWKAAILCFGASVAFELLGVFLPERIRNLRIPSVVLGLSVLGFLLTHPPTEKMFWWCVHAGRDRWLHYSLDCLVTLGPLLQLCLPQRPTIDKSFVPESWSGPRGLLRAPFDSWIPRRPAVPRSGRGANTPSGNSRFQS